MFLPGESQGWGSLGGLPSMGSRGVGHDWSDLAAQDPELGESMAVRPEIQKADCGQ